MDNPVFKSIYARVCMGAGLAALSGVRAFLPVAFLALYSRLEFFSAPILDGDPVRVPREDLGHRPAVRAGHHRADHRQDPGIASAAPPDHAPHPDRSGRAGVRGGHGSRRLDLHDQSARSSACSSPAWPSTPFTPCGPAHGRRTIETAPFVLLSIYADVLVLVGTLLFVLVPLIGALFACLMFLFVYRLRQRRKRKHKGLRILKG